MPEVYVGQEGGGRGTHHDDTGDEPCAAAAKWVAKVPLPTDLLLDRTALQFLDEMQSTNDRALEEVKDIGDSLLKQARRSISAS